MIGPVHRFADLIPHHDGERYLVPIASDRAPLDTYAESVAVDLGIVFGAQPCNGQYFAFEPDKLLVRAPYYVLVREGEVLDGVRAIVEAMHAEFGPGRAWTLGGRVHVVSDDGANVAVDVGGERHLLLRAFVCHENGPTRDKPRVEKAGA